MAKLDEFRRKASTMKQDDFVARHGRPFLVALGVTSGKPSPRRGGATGTLNYQLSQQALMGAHPLAGQVFELVAKDGKAPRVKVGRTDANDVAIVDASVSGEHCVFHFGKEGARVEDAGSTNGTYLNGDRLSAHVPCPIDDEDVLTLGRYNFAYLSPKVFYLTLALLSRQ